MDTASADKNDLKDTGAFLGFRGLDWREARLEDVGEFVAWLQLPPAGRAGEVAVLPSVTARSAASTVNRKLAAVSAFYRFHARHGVKAGEVLRVMQAPGRGYAGTAFRVFLLEGPAVSAVRKRRGLPSRSWLYAQDDLRGQIERLRTRQQQAPAAPQIPDRQRATPASLLRRLEAATTRIRALEADNRQLRDAFEHALGEKHAAAILTPAATRPENTP